MATQVEAHITGTVLRVAKNVGDSVIEGEIVVILESMKMEMPIEAPAPGTVRAIRVEEGQSVNEGEIIALLE